MGRGSIVDDANQNAQAQEQPEPEQDQATEADDGERVRKTHRIPQDLYDRIEAAKGELGFSSTNELMNFLMTKSLNDLGIEADE